MNHRPTIPMAVAAALTCLAAPKTIPDNRLITAIPIYFEPNHGQFDSQVRFIARGAKYQAWITDSKLVLQLKDKTAPVVIQFGPQNATKRNIEGLDKQIGTSSYFIGNDKSKWVTGVPSFAKAKLIDVYPGIDVVFYAQNETREIEYDFVVKPGADPSQISIDFDPKMKPKAGPLGEITMRTPAGDLRHWVPSVHQGNKQVAYKSAFDGKSLRFQLGEYDRNESLVIDPAVAFSTYLGGSSLDQIQAVALDPTGAPYVTGLTQSTNFPFVNPGAAAPAQTAYSVFATKFGTTAVQGVRPRIYSVYFGVNQPFQLIWPVHIAVDRTGAAYIATTNATLSMPVRNAAQPNWNGETDGWVGKISATPGANGYDFEYGTYLGGMSGDSITGIAVDSDGAAYVTGVTGSPNFPVSNSQQTTLRSADAFVVKIAARPRAGTTVFHYVYSLLYGGSASEFPSAIAVDSTGAAYIAGSTTSLDLPVARAFQPNNSSLTAETTGFVAKFSATPNATTGVYGLVYGTYFGGNADQVAAIAVDGAGSAFIAGLKQSNLFPVVRQLPQYGIAAGFVAKIGASANNSGVHPLLFSSPLFGGLRPNSIALDSAGAVYVGSNFFDANGPRLVDPALIYVPGSNGHVLKLSIPDTGDATVLYSTAAGPALNDIAVDAAGTVYVGGETGERTVPVVQGNASTTPSVPNDGYLMALSSGPSPFSVVIQANRYEIPFVVTGPPACNPGSYVAPASFTWPSGTQCTVQPQALVDLETLRHQFLKWEDNNSTTATRTITAGAGSQTYILNYDRFLRVRVQVTEGQGTISPAPTSFFLEGTINQITATPASGSVFFRWEGGPYVGNPASTTINTPVLDGPVELFARFVPAAPAQGATQFLPLTPCRLADTRQTPSPGMITGGSVREFPVTGRCGVPASATAVSLNVTVVPRRGSLGFLTLFPTGQTRPTVSTMNSLDGRIKANSAIIRTGTNGSVSVFVTDDADVILDVNGAFMAPGALTLAYYPVTPCRVLDTRTTAGAPRLAAQASRTINVQASTCGIPATARAYAMNATVIPTARLGFLRITPTGAAATDTSTLNALTGTIVANQVIVRAGTNGAIDAFATDATDLILDINGYFAPAGQPGALNFYPVDPCRSLDSRASIGGGIGASITQLNHSVAPSCPAVPLAARAFSVNVTAIPAAGTLGYLSITPQSSTTPRVSLLNALDGAITNNAAILQGIPDLFSIFATDRTHLLIDVNGYFAQ